jgi:integrase
MRRSHGSAPRVKEAAVTEVVAAMVKPLGRSLIDVRDRAILLIGFAGAMRRSELASLELADIAETGDGLRITVGRSKTDQEGEGSVVGITYGSNPPTCPVRAWRAWCRQRSWSAGRRSGSWVTAV